MKTGADFRLRATMYGITQWPIGKCSICGDRLQYEFGDTQAYYSAGCFCTFNSGAKIHVSWDHIADHYNLQTDAVVISNYNKFWHFDK